MVAGDELDDILAKLPRGLIGRAAKTTDSGSIGSTETAYMEFRAVLPRGRQLRFELPSFYAVATAAGCITHYNVRVAYDGAVVSTPSDLFASTRAYHATTYQTKVEPIEIEFDTTDQVAELREVRFLMTGYRATGSGTFIIKSQVEATTPVQMLLYDSGLPVGNAGVDNTVIQYTSVWDASAIYVKGNVLADLLTGIGGGETALGDYADPWWAQATFTGNAVSGEKTKTVADALSGATIVKAELILTASAYSTDVASFNILTNTDTAADPTPPSGTAVFKSKNVGVSTWRVWHDITSIFTAASRGVDVGYPGAGYTSSEMFLIASGSSNKVQLRLTYKR